MTISSKRVKFLDKQTTVLVQDFTKFTSNSILSNVVTPGLAEEALSLANRLTNGALLKELNAGLGLFNSAAADLEKARAFYSAILKDISLHAVQLSWVLPILNNLKTLSDDKLAVFVKAMMSQVADTLYQNPQALNEFNPVSSDTSSKIFLLALREFNKTMGNTTQVQMKKTLSTTMELSEINTFISSLGTMSVFGTGTGGQAEEDDGFGPSPIVTYEPEAPTPVEPTVQEVAPDIQVPQPPSQSAQQVPTPKAPVVVDAPIKDTKVPIPYVAPIPPKEYPPDGLESSQPVALDVASIAKGRNTIAYCNWLTIKVQVLYAAYLHRDPSDPDGDAQTYYTSKIGDLDRVRAAMESALWGSSMYSRNRIYTASRGLMDFVNHGLAAAIDPSSPKEALSQALAAILGFCAYINKHAESLDEITMRDVTANQPTVEKRALKLTLDLVDAARGGKGPAVGTADSKKAKEICANMAMYLIKGPPGQLAGGYIDEGQAYDRRLYPPLKLWMAFILTVVTTVKGYIDSPAAAAMHAPLMKFTRDALVLCLHPYGSGTVMPFDLTPSQPAPSNITMFATEGISAASSATRQEPVHPHFSNIAATDAAVRARVFAFLKYLTPANTKWLFNGIHISAFEGSKHPGASMLLAYYTQLNNIESKVKQGTGVRFKESTLGRSIAAGVAGADINKNDLMYLYDHVFSYFNFSDRTLRISMLKETISLDNLELTEKSGIVSTAV